MLRKITINFAKKYYIEIDLINFLFTFSSILFTQSVFQCYANYLQVHKHVILNDSRKQSLNS